ncbi:Mov34/MPN/PAD-1 family protein [Bordetella genomosp. 12]|uniref:JAB domain-containing protein n=1 Tax=Bordetella genomosp. 12 TaxID=463035 RepID=A0A261VEV4_9BORD|nr:Mov34/MPN/PAD-1 family protein [Bordetella genomosp. 12]OZI71683.1 hypothetical protein CAL22_17960 [Bordetella genomosp. 12]
MNEEALIYALPGAIWSLVFPPDVLGVLRGNAQKSKKSREMAGQLYAKNLASDRILIDTATILTPKRSWFTGVKIDIAAVDAERAMMFAGGLHCLGFWHSHPEPIPQPSYTDQVLAAKHAVAAREEFTALVFVIIGTETFPDGLGVWVHDGTKLLRAVNVIPQAVV